MRLIIECEHGQDTQHRVALRQAGPSSFAVCDPPSITDPDAILAALAEAGRLDVEQQYAYHGYQSNGDPNVGSEYRYVSPWKEAK